MRSKGSSGRERSQIKGRRQVAGERAPGRGGEKQPREVGEFGGGGGGDGAVASCCYCCCCCCACCGSGSGW
jgi:hypothetical protein